MESKKLVKKSTGDILGTITISIGVAQLRAGRSRSRPHRPRRCLPLRAKDAGRNRVISETDAARQGCRSVTPLSSHLALSPMLSPRTFGETLMRKDFERAYVTAHGDVAVLTLNHPEVMNAAAPKMIRGLTMALDHVERADSGFRAIVMTGEGRGFCSGANLSEVSGRTMRARRRRLGAGDGLSSFPAPLARSEDCRSSRR